MHTMKCSCMLAAMLAAVGLAMTAGAQTVSAALDGAISIKSQEAVVDVPLVAVTSAHRGMSFQGCEYIMDYLKSLAPFWKKEQTPQGARWVDARVSDDAALARWGIEASNAER